MMEGIRDNDIQAMVIGIVFSLGAYISIIIWVYRNKVIPIWMIFTTLGCINPTFLRKYFLEGPGFPIFIVWMIVAGLCGFVITPILLSN